MYSFEDPGFWLHVLGVAYAVVCVALLRYTLANLRRARTPQTIGVTLALPPEQVVRSFAAAIASSPASALGPVTVHEAAAGRVIWSGGGTHPHRGELQLARSARSVHGVTAITSQSVFAARAVRLAAFGLCLLLAEVVLLKTLVTPSRGSVLLMMQPLHATLLLASLLTERTRRSHDRRLAEAERVLRNLPFTRDAAPASLSSTK